MREGWVIFALCKGFFLFNFQSNQCSLSPFAVVIQCSLKIDLVTGEYVKGLLPNPVVVFFRSVIVHYSRTQLLVVSLELQYNVELTLLTLS